MNMAIHTIYCDQQKIKVRINMLISFIITCNCTTSNFWEILQIWLCECYKNSQHWHWSEIWTM